MQKISPFLWFDGQAEEAVTFYVSLFKNSKINMIARYGDEVPEMKGKVLTASFVLDGVEFMAIDGGPHYKINEAISFFVHCEDQAEVDHLWDKLAEGGKPLQCGWITDKFGLTWQIIPKLLGKLMSDPDPKKSGRVMQAMLQMVKIDEALLYQAYNQE
ncbi:VOC family protein [Candidatus Woesebacteria bacterium]|jgi:predicted 3-demethylubiquinone-9 3-methyltransferase (glyoxalase superfamily)|nr:VOC family protein [Candidatus Woesebacteria bacterium]MBP9687622.1 VOC family protein [Candidatus Woesebacteria bacterium]